MTAYRPPDPVAGLDRAPDDLGAASSRRTADAGADVV